MTDDRLRQTFEAEATELEARRTNRATGRHDVDHVPQAQRVASPSVWRKAVLPVAAVLLAVVGVVGFSVLRSGDPEPELPQSEVASQSSEATAEAAPTADAELADEDTLSEETPSDEYAPTPAQSSSERVIEPASSGELFYHTVLPGDTLAAIAERYLVTVDAIIRINIIDTPNELRVGRELLIPPPGIQPVPELATPEPGNPVPPPITGGESTSLSCVYGITAPDFLNLRAGPSLDAAILAELQPDECGLQIVSVSDDGQWMQVDRTVDDTILRGWASFRFLGPDVGGLVLPPPPEPSAPLCVSGISAPDTLMLRAGPGTEFEVLQAMAPGTCQLLPLSESAGWTRLAVPDPATGSIVEGWAASAYLGIGVGQPTVSPVARMATLQFSFIYPDFAGPETLPPDAAAFVLMLEQDGTIITNLDAQGTAMIDASLLGARVRVEAPWANDPFCWFTGATAAFDTSVRVVELDAVCA